MPTAFNKETGEMLVLDRSGKWAKPVTAANPQTGEKLYLDGEEWKPVPLSRNEYGAGAAASVLQGPLMGAGDEFTAALENPTAAARAAFEGENENTRGYYKSLRRFRSFEERFRQANPGTALGLTVAGSLAGGGMQLGRQVFGTVSRALPKAGALTRAAATGAAFGAPAGFASGEGDFLNRIASSVFGTAAGAAVGVVFEAIAPALAGFYRQAVGNPALWDAQAGRLTPAGLRAAEEAGINPQEASEALSREFGEQARNARVPGEAAAVAEGASLPAPVRLTRGQTTLRPDDQMFESQAAKDVYGQAAGVPMRTAFDAQQEALRQNMPAVQSRIAGGQARVGELGQGVQATQDALSTAERASKGSVNRLYEDARARSMAFVQSSEVQTGLQTIGAELRADGFTPQIARRVHRILGQREATRGASQGGVPIAELFDMRRQFSALSGSSDRVEATAAGRAKKAFDKWLTDTIDGDLLSGDRASIERWRKAIAARKDYGSRFQGGDLVEKLTARTYQGGQSVLEADPNAAVNLIFGRAATGWVSKSGLLRDMMRVREELGPQSQAWNALREEAFLRFARSADGAATPTGREFSGAKFAKAWEDAQRTNGEVVRVLFTEPERNLISQFARVARRVTTNVKGGANTSNTSAGVAQAMRRLFASAFMGPKMAAFLSDLPVVKAISNLGYTLKAEAAARNTIRTGSRPVPEANYALPAVVQGGVQSPPARRLSADFNTRADTGPRVRAR